jgi:antagonist of KipI
MNPVLQVLDTGFLTTIQGPPLYGWARYGLSEAGAMCPNNLLLSNFLCGNTQVLPSLEFTLKPPRLLFRAPARIALSGADFGWKLDGRQVDTRRSLLVKAGETLHGDYCRSGLRGYLSVFGGLSASAGQNEQPGQENCKAGEFSASTHVDAKLGGRVLRKGDLLGLPEPRYSNQSFQLRDSPPPAALLNGAKVLRIIPGPHASLFPPEALSLLGGAMYRVTEQSSRVAVRVEGLSLPAPQEPILSCGAWHGAIQVPPSGLPQILGCEHPATGGYPILASVITADLDTLGQLRPREEFRFGLVSLPTACALLERVQDWLRNAITPFTASR